MKRTGCNIPLVEDGAVIVDVMDALGSFVGLLVGSFIGVALREGFPDVSVNVEAIIVEGNKAVIRSMSGTH